MKTFLNTLAYEFGFNNFADFMDSLIHTKLLGFTVPAAITLSSIGAFAEYSFGMQVGTMIALIVLLALELITGIWAAKCSGFKIESRKFARFGLKVVVWFGLFYVMNTLTMQFEDSEGLLNSMAHTTFAWMYSLMLVFVTMEYLISVLENYSRITGDDTSPIIRAIRNRLDKVLGNSEDDEFFGAKDNLLAIANKNGKFEKINDKWEEVLGTSKEDLLTHPWIYFVHPEDIENTLDSIKVKKEDSKTIEFINRYKRSDGQYVKLSWSGTPKVNGNCNYTVTILEQPMWVEDHLVNKE